MFKRRFLLADTAPEYSEKVQAMFVPALGSIHNFIRIYDPSDEAVQPWRAVTARAAKQQQSPAPNPHAEPHVITAAELGIDITPVERQRAADRRDRLAEQMWVDYQEELHQREGL